MLSPDYVTGLAEASGSFTYSRAPSNNITVYFALRLPARDALVLDELQRFFGVGRIYSVSGGLYYRVSRHDELLRVVEHFASYPLRGHKAEAFEVWRQMVEIKARFRRPDLERLGRLAEKLSSLTVSRARPATT